MYADDPNNGLTLWQQIAAAIGTAAASFFSGWSLKKARTAQRETIDIEKELAESESIKSLEVRIHRLELARHRDKREILDAITAMGDSLRGN